MSSVTDALSTQLAKLDMSTASSQLMQNMRERPLLTTFAALGSLWAYNTASDLFSFAWLHFIRRTQLDRYKGTSSDPAWALITGASDGIGRGFAEELLSQGFNVVLHGRTESKLNGVKNALSKQNPDRQIRVLVFDASDVADNEDKLEAACRELQDINLKVLINNVGGDGGHRPVFTPLHEKPAGNTAKMLGVNAHFPTEITRILLPQLIRNTPALIINIGSGVSEIAGPFLSVYSGAKAFNKSWSRSMMAEMKVQGLDIEVLHVMVGLVATNSAKDRKPGFLIASARGMAASALSSVGCGRSDVWSYWPHALQFGIMLNLLPPWVVNNFATNIVKKEREMEQARLKQA